MNKHCLVSIITVCLNSEKTIERTINSVLNQTYDNIEYVVIDGISTDNTLNIIEKYRHVLGNRLKLISEKDNGIYDAMNKGISYCSGELIGICNSDDWLEPNAIEEIVKVYDPIEPYQILYGAVRDWYGDKEASIVRNHHNSLEHRKVLEHPGCFVTKKLYEDHGLYNTYFFIGADYEFMMREYYKYHSKYVPVDAIVSNFSLGGASYGYETHWQHSEILYNYGQMEKKEFFREKYRYWIKKYLIYRKKKH